MLNMTRQHDGSLSTYDESFELPIENLIVQGQFLLPGGADYSVRVYTDIKKGHKTQSPEPMLEHPTVYNSIGHTIAHGRHYMSNSRAKAHLDRKPYGHTEVYQLDNLYEKLDNTNWSMNMPDYSMVVPVFYPYDGTNPRAVTCYIAPNPTGRNLG